MAKKDMQKPIRQLTFRRASVLAAESGPRAGWARPDATSNGPIGGALKRCCDLLVAGVTLAFAAPLMALIAIVIVMCDGRSPFYGHVRVGYGGRLFRCWKFRTMVVDAEAALERHLAQNPDAAKAWETSFKLDRDPRITWIGEVLRRSSLDELPQLFNVMRGDMSCVGPRPVITAELAKYGPAAHDYLSARPGITGLWQVRGRSRTTYERRVALDVEYVRTWSPMLDLKILARTVPAVMDFDATS